MKINRNKMGGGSFKVLSLIGVLMMTLIYSYAANAFVTIPGYVCNINYTPKASNEIAASASSAAGDRVYMIESEIMPEWDDTNSSSGTRQRQEYYGIGAPGQLYVAIATTATDCTNLNYNITAGYFDTWGRTIHAAPYSETALMTLWTNLRSQQTAGRKVVLKGTGSSVPLTGAEFTSCDFR